MRLSSRSFLILAFIIRGGFSGLVRVEQPAPSERSAAELASAVLDALAYADAAREKLDQTPADKDLFAATMTRMTNARIAKRRFQDARALFVNEVKSKRQTVNLVGTAFTVAFEALEKGCDRGVALDEAIVKAKTQDDIAKIAADGSAIAADVDEAWRLLPQGILALSFALVDEGRLTDGKLQHLRLTSGERASLISRITRDYPNVGQQKGGHAIDVSASVLLNFLKGDHKSADAK